MGGSLSLPASRHRGYRGAEIEKELPPPARAPPAGQTRGNREITSQIGVTPVPRVPSPLFPPLPQPPNRPLLRTPKKRDRLPTLAFAAPPGAPKTSLLSTALSRDSLAHPSTSQRALPRLTPPLCLNHQ